MSRRIEKNRPTIAVFRRCRSTRMSTRITFACLSGCKHFSVLLLSFYCLFSHSIEYRPFFRIDNCVGIESDSDNDGCCWRIVNSRSCPANDVSKRLTLIQLSGQFECRVNDDKTMENFVLNAMRRQLRKPNNMVGWFALCCTSLIFMYNVCVFFFFVFIIIIIIIVIRELLFCRTIGRSLVCVQNCRNM
jgi:hypothetical protein